MKIYRFERYGVGPFVRFDIRVKDSRSKRKQARAVHVRNMAARNRESWRDAHNKAVMDGYLFGAESKEHLKAYFSYDLQRLFKQGYKIKAYEVPDDAVRRLGAGEVAFPVRYHKLRTRKNVERTRYERVAK